MPIQHTHPERYTRFQARAQAFLPPSPRAPLDGTPAVPQLSAKLDRGPILEGAAPSRKERRVPRKSNLFSGVAGQFPGTSRTSFRGPGEDGEEEEENSVEEEESDGTEGVPALVGESQSTGGPTLTLSDQPVSQQSEPSLLAILKQMTQIMANLQAASFSESFIQSSQLIFHNDPANFFQDRKNVLYSTSFLIGRAAKWIEPYLSNLTNQYANYLLNSWSLFSSQLLTSFVDPNEVGKAEAELDSLRMKEGGHVSLYIADLKILVSRTGDWGERALSHHFEKGFPSRILDQLASHPSSIDSLQGFMDVTLELDSRYHERQKEKKPEASKSKEEVIDTPKGEDLILGFDFLNHFNPRIDWRQRLITFNADNKNYYYPSKSFSNDFSSAKSCAALVGDSRTPSFPSSVHIPSFNSHPSLLSSRDEVFKEIQDVGEDNYVSPLYLFFGNMDLPPSSYDDFLEEFWDEEEDPEELETVLKVFPSAYHQYLEVFSKVKAEKLPPHRDCDHHIELEGSLPPVGMIYSLSNKESDILRTYISENEEEGFMRPSSSSTGEPIIFVKKKDGSLCLCIDYHKLIVVTSKNKYPVPPMNQLLTVFNGSSICSRIDLRGAYNLLRIKEGDEHLTVFRTKYGSYKYFVMPFGLTNAPAFFQNLVNDIFHYFLDIYVVDYLHYILVFSKSEEAHVTHVSTVLSRLCHRGSWTEIQECPGTQQSGNSLERLQKNKE
ncbi:hypothetical protein O181_051495 [Austropuccinia psidii MF-1]|uniref:Reverse transcriptase domain-containing protein n=1 Tax=Austropuccinia psidii MF-1 TaxID=1389203 RepID=A0A9Q3HRU9_9BASI|nr:hypothetical protein [Austropuccinia psidii MF-1]